jgi:glycosyltransferase involved in cell wall biosynthesis
MRFIAWIIEPGFNTGQGIVTQRVLSLPVPGGWRIVRVRGAGFTYFFSWLRSIFKIYCLALSKDNVVYFAPSRAPLGFLRDLPIFFLQFARSSLVAHIHGADLPNLLERRAISSLTRKLFWGCHLIVPSDHLKNPILKHIPSARISICENFLVSSESASPCHNLHPSPADFGRKKRVCFVWNSNVMATKGFLQFADAIVNLNKEKPVCFVRCAGRPLADALARAGDIGAALTALRAHDWFLYLGEVSPEEAYRITADGDVVCLPSYSECQPLSLIQAMCAGVMIIASDIPGNRAVLKDYPALFFPAGETEELEECMRGIVFNADLRGELRQKCQQGSAIARDRFSSERFNRELLAILVEVARSGRKRDLASIPS